MLQEIYQNDVETLEREVSTMEEVLENIRTLAIKALSDKDHPMFMFVDQMAEELADLALVSDSIRAMVRKCQRLDAVKQSCPSTVTESITHWTNQAYNVDQNINDLLNINEEISKQQIAPSENKNSNGSIWMNDDAMNNFKERATDGLSTAPMSFFIDNEM